MRDLALEPEEPQPEVRVRASRVVNRAAGRVVGVGFMRDYGLAGRNSA
jgi:hypothetical protein